MIVFLLLVIIAIMLMGASRFIGIVGAILGIVVFIIAVTLGISAIGKATGADGGDVLLYVIVGGGVLALIGWMIFEAQKPTSHSISTADRANEERLLRSQKRTSHASQPKEAPRERHQGKWDLPGDFDGY